MLMVSLFITALKAETAKTSIRDEWIKKMHYFHTKAHHCSTDWCDVTYGPTPEASHYMKESRCKRLHSKGPILYEICRKGEPIETDSRLPVTGAETKYQGVSINEYSVAFGVRRIFCS